MGRLNGVTSGAFEQSNSGEHSESGEHRNSGQGLGLPESGRGSLASFPRRIAAFVVDWAACLIVAAAPFGAEAVFGDSWRATGTLIIFFVEATLLTTLLGGSFGQLCARITVARLDDRPVGFVRAISRTALVCLGLPPLVMDKDRRGLHDLALGTAVLNRR